MKTTQHHFLSLISSRLISSRRLPAVAAAGALLFLGTVSTSERTEAPGMLDMTAARDMLQMPDATGIENACSTTALALRFASLSDAQSDFFVGAANCLNDPEANFGVCLFDLIKELGEANNEANQQYTARLHVCKLLGEDPYDPDIKPKDFSSKITNTYFPFKAGRTLVYEKKGSSATETERITITLLKGTVEIDGVECAQVRDLVEIGGEVCEDTTDFYAQDKKGNVWYFGEVAKNFEDGFLDNLDGSWRTGKDDAKPGILMQAKPKFCDTYRQEFLANEAEDVATVIGFNRTVTVPAGTFKNCLETEDFTPLEPGVRERKFYAPGIGLVLEVNPETKERTELVKIVN